MPVPRNQRNGRARQPERPKPRLTAATADKHALYEISVQCPEADIRFFDRVYRAEYHAIPKVLREDFCGTANLSCEWVRTRPRNHAVGIDLDPSVLAYSRQKHVPGLGEKSRRLQLIQGNVLDDHHTGAHIVASMNFSYFIFKDRRTMLAYFRGVRGSLAPKGLFVLDIMGGPEAQVPQRERKEVEGFTYVWDQASFNPITHAATNHIHFEFRDGTRMTRAFSYHWRLWFVPELSEILEDAGFRRVDMYWEGTNREGHGDGVFRRSVRGDNSPAWIGYLVAVP
jgi:SAM-dependent methyltransferase